MFLFESCFAGTALEDDALISSNRSSPSMLFFMEYAFNFVSCVGSSLAILELTGLGICLLSVFTGSVYC